MGAHQLSRRQRHHSSSERLVRSQVWTQAFPDHLHCDLHGFVLSVRRGDQPGDDPDRASRAGRGRRRTAALVAGDSAGKLSAGQARVGDGGVRARRGRRACARPHPGRMAHRHVLLAMGILYKHSDRRAGYFHVVPFRRRSAVHQGCETGKDGLYRSRSSRYLSCVSADHSRQGTGSRLVRRHLAALDGGDHDRCADRISDSRIEDCLAAGAI